MLDLLFSEREVRRHQYSAAFRELPRGEKVIQTTRHNLVGKETLDTAVWDLAKDEGRGGGGRRGGNKGLREAFPFFPLEVRFGVRKCNTF